ncbi:Rha family transcriptional regulator [Salmonella enterica]|nr:Rha family transcriptional regulator [Salmonella enterica]EJU2682203.1 Rha family transcriptional regulator [Salmonella enterica]EJX3840193.1 Rha family transcriptional regulator [Salmonella enterica]EJX4246248.1 Rha family transcriptional regulator [Salmonella enterica]EJX4535243.1 Rha family transcriptional regulator [Salmonella enterica]
MSKGLDSVINGRYVFPAPYKTGAGRGNPLITKAHNRAHAVFLRAKHRHTQIMVGRAGQPQGWPGSLVTGISTPVRLTTYQVVESLGGELNKFTKEAAIMATTPTLSHPQVTIENGRAVTTSMAVALYFKKLHKDVLKKIDNLDCSPEFTSANFCAHAENIKAGAVNRDSRSYKITKDGFVFLVMGFTGKKAAAFKEAYIAEFNRMEATLHDRAIPAPAEPSPAERDAYNVQCLMQHYRVFLEAWTQQIEPALKKLESPLVGRLHDRFGDGWIFLNHLEKSLSGKLLPGQSPRIFNE